MEKITHVPREALIRKMKAAPRHVYLSAPGGYGKTVAAWQWFVNLRGKKAQINIRDTDNDPAVFFGRLSRAMAKIGTKTESDSLEALLEAIRLLPKRGALAYLLLDDWHVLKNEAVSSGLLGVAMLLPAYVRLCVVSRSEADAALVESGLFCVLNQADLEFSPQEVEWLAVEKGRHLTQGQIASLLELTKGWAIQISILLSNEDYDETPRPLFEYFEKQVWRPWDADAKALLLCLSIPAEVTPKLAEHLSARTGGKQILDRLAKKDNAFLSPGDDGSYRFHDLFRDFLLERLDDQLSAEEIQRLNDICAKWYFGRGDYFMAMKHFAQNQDHEGIILCERACTQYHAETENASVEATCNFLNLQILSLPISFVMKNHFLIVECAYVAFLDGDAENFLYYKDALVARMPEIAERYPDLVETAGFLCSLDFRIPMIEYAKHLATMLPHMETDDGGAVRSNTVTQNLPYFHRSMRDFSEIHQLREEDLALFRDTFGLMIGADYQIMEQALIAGIYYERGELLSAIFHATSGYGACGRHTNPEARFCIHMILAAILCAMDARTQAEKVMEETEAYLEERAPFLMANFRALQTERQIRAGDADAARQWLLVHACHAEHLPFYQVCRHFCCLRALIAVGEHGTAGRLGKRLEALAKEYGRPMDQIEAGILLAIALQNGGDEKGALRCLEQAVSTAMHYGFVQLFVNEGKAVLPILWKLGDSVARPSKQLETYFAYIDRIIRLIYEKHGLGKGERPELSPQQAAMLPYLARGMSYREIATESGIGYDTVKSHVRLVYKRLGVHSAAEAALKARVLGLL